MKKFVKELMVLLLLSAALLCGTFMASLSMNFIIAVITGRKISWIMTTVLTLFMWMIATSTVFPVEA